jgi:hypothetical protein
VFSADGKSGRQELAMRVCFLFSVVYTVYWVAIFLELLLETPQRSSNRKEFAYTETGKGGEESREKERREEKVKREG